MTYSHAVSEAGRLAAIARKWGVPTSVEIQAGRGADPWGVYTKYLRMWHHTASWYRPDSLTPLLWLVKAGRSDVPGPLCNGYLGWDGVFRIICMGEANHPGRGGPVTIDGVRVPANSARRPTWGIEVEGGYQDWEAVHAAGGPDMLRAMGLLDCALAEWSGRPLTSQLEHKTWAPDRKVDRRGFDGARERGIALSRHWFAQVDKEPEPDQVQEDHDTMLHVIRDKDDANAPWYVTDFAQNTRHVRSVKELSEIIWLTVVNGGKIGLGPGNGPQMMSADVVASIAREVRLEEAERITVQAVNADLERLSDEVRAWKAAVEAAG